jgi:hypothetical protein
VRGAAFYRVCRRDDGSLTYSFLHCQHQVRGKIGRTRLLPSFSFPYRDAPRLVEPHPALSCRDVIVTRQYFNLDRQPMSAPFSTLLLDVSSWDLTTDTQGNIAVASGAYAIAQDMGSQCRQWRGEYIYNQADGVPLSSILGESPSLALLKSDFATAAGQVPGVSNTVCFVSSVRDRLVTGQVQATLVSTNTVVATSIGGQTIVIPTKPTFTLDISTLGGPDVLG